ncbi:hypothetical protein ACIRRH_00840 [Kitasatospora sp. NPDC101235]
MPEAHRSHARRTAPPRHRATDESVVHGVTEELTAAELLEQDRA